MSLPQGGPFSGQNDIGASALEQAGASQETFFGSVLGVFRLGKLAFWLAFGGQKGAKMLQKGPSRGSNVEALRCPSRKGVRFLGAE